MVGTDGSIVELDQAKKDYIVNDVVENYATQTWRTMLVTYADYSSDEWEALQQANNDFRSADDMAAVEKDLVFTALFGLVDPLREKVKEAVA